MHVWLIIVVLQCIILPNISLCVWGCTAVNIVERFCWHKQWPFQFLFVMHIRWKCAVLAVQRMCFVKPVFNTISMLTLSLYKHSTVRTQAVFSHPKIMVYSTTKLTLNAGSTPSNPRVLHDPLRTIVKQLNRLKGILLLALRHLLVQLESAIVEVLNPLQVNIDCIDLDDSHSKPAIPLHHPLEGSRPTTRRNINPCHPLSFTLSCIFTYQGQCTNLWNLKNWSSGGMQP